MCSTHKVFWDPVARMWAQQTAAAFSKKGLGQKIVPVLESLEGSVARNTVLKSNALRDRAKELMISAEKFILEHEKLLSSDDYKFVLAFHHDPPYNMILVLGSKLSEPVRDWYRSLGVE